MDAGASGISGIAEFHWEKRDIVAKLGATDLHLRGDVGSLAAKNGAAGGIRQRRGFARLIQKHEALHQRDACGRRHAGKRFPVSSREKTDKLGLILGASRGEHGFQCAPSETTTTGGPGAALKAVLSRGCSFAGRARRASAGLGTGIL